MKDNILDFFEDVRDRLSEFSGLQLAAAAVIAVCVVGVTVAVLGSGGAGAEYEAKYQENLTEITRLNSELTALTNENERRPDASEITVAMKSANTAGMAVAGLQTAYQDCVVNAGETGSEGFESAITKNAEALDVYFDDTAKNARVPWFTVTGDTPARLVWTFMTNYTFSAETVECLWLCRDNAGNLVAFTLGTYSGSTGLFSDVHYYATAYGNKNYRTPDDPVSTYSVDLTDGSGSVTVGTDAMVRPEGYSFDENGNLIGPDGEPYMGDENWAADFEDAFKNSQAYREQMLQKGDAMKNGD